MESADRVHTRQNYYQYRKFITNEPEQMITSANRYTLVDIFPVDKSLMFEVPLYQREYDWRKDHREALFDDIAENEQGYCPRFDNLYTSYKRPTC